MSNDQYKLDRNYVSKMSFEKADDHTTYWLDKLKMKIKCGLLSHQSNI